MPAPIVVDASLTFRLLLPGPQQEQCRALVTGWLREGCELVATTLWVYEMTSAVCKLVHLGELSAEEGERVLAQLQAMEVRLMAPDAAQVQLAFNWTRRLERAAAYDSFYLALAETLGCPFWTADRHLVRAANTPWVHWAFA